MVLSIRNVPVCILIAWLIIFQTFFGGCDRNKNDSPPIQDNLSGTWSLIWILDEDVLYSYETANTKVNLDFNFEDNTYAGTTNHNEFFGDFEKSENRLVLTRFITTEVAETDYGQIFYAAINESFNSENDSHDMTYTIASDKLYITSGTTSLHFIKEEF